MLSVHAGKQASATATPAIPAQNPQFEAAIDADNKEIMDLFKAKATA
jgi:hypothetical protein